MKKVMIILGPTAVGKSEVALACAKALNGEIISADSMQIYKKLNIGTAKTLKTEMQEIPHHLIDIKNFKQSYNVWEFVNDCKKLVDKIIKNNKVPILVGGTNLYINALIKNYDFANETNKKEDMYQSEFPITYSLYALNMPRDLLYEKINKRVDIMLENGLLEEIKNLKKQGLSVDLQAGKSIGYRELLQFLDGKISYENAIDKIKQHSRNYAKRQLTWLRSMENLVWLDALNKQKSINQIIENEKLNNF
ncbi:MAG: tRNA (adenosine(37)-N6)-dimethylallyltransferase MiaA [Clostridia bacterium]|nr:tRNA (adenosine(37)-N6)-dimethylallyltransferase MiaA [Clostridia bacterium]